MVVTHSVDQTRSDCRTESRQQNGSPGLFTAPFYIRVDLTDHTKTKIPYTFEAHIPLRNIAIRFVREGIIDHVKVPNVMPKTSVKGLVAGVFSAMMASHISTEAASSPVCWDGTPARVLPSAPTAAATIVVSFCGAERRHRHPRDYSEHAYYSCCSGETHDRIWDAFNNSSPTLSPLCATLHQQVSVSL